MSWDGRLYTQVSPMKMKWLLKYAKEYKSTCSGMLALYNVHHSSINNQGIHLESDACIPMQYWYERDGHRFNVMSLTCNQCGSFKGLHEKIEAFHTNSHRKGIISKQNSKYFLIFCFISVCCYWMMNK